MPQQFLDGFHRRLHQAIVIKIDEAMVNLAGGQAKDYAEYRQRVGRIEALNDVLDWCKEVERAEYGVEEPATAEQE